MCQLTFQMGMYYGYGKKVEYFRWKNHMTPNNTYDYQGSQYKYVVTYVCCSFVLVLAFKHFA